jgi:hypothetical protein
MCVGSSLHPNLDEAQYTTTAVSGVATTPEEVVEDDKANALMNIIYLSLVFIISAFLY